ncbi:hypothetical protein I546_0952 [Mycobacterium kansasii 732]|uniref:hypothetical protein n=1 Tax=Mycobacterium pseudokansasii TaxID=2341080 RepID=UPI000448E186|nr:hypothetical protein [Mycobacterium pseudokansasii]EUA15647.1 hypothetical protein I546_0952 [Mycobacterium kansasii 732]KZS66775.1 hypothetical protein A4G27_16795 [Mycobacterium kansasii]MBY0389012.1 hypothetical protein [Mycobacterium pseudokansasii]
MALGDGVIGGASAQSWALVSANPVLSVPGFATLGAGMALVPTALTISVASVAIHYTGAFEAAGQCHRDAIVSPAV